MAVLLLAGYVCHLVPTAMAALFVTVLALTMGGGGIKARLHRLAPVILAGVPIGLLAIWFLLDQRSSQPPGPSAYPYRLWRLKDLGRFQKAFAHRATILAAINVALFAGVSAWLPWRRRNRRFNVGRDAFLLIAALCGALFLLMPDEAAGGSMLVVRLAMFPLLALLFWWAVQPISSEAFRRLRFVCTSVSTAVALLLIAAMSFAYARFAPYFQDMEAAVLNIDPNSTLLLTADGYFRLNGPDVLQGGGFRQAAQRGIVVINCQPATTNYHAIRYRSGLSPRENAIAINLSDYVASTGKQVDYVLLSSGPVPYDSPAIRLMLKQIQDGYDLVFRSPQTGCATL